MADPFDWLASLEFFGIKLGLAQTRELFRRLGDPQKSLRFVHVAGSNGKGSVCALLESAFRHAGLKTGFYSSPHLVKPNERFKINAADVDDRVLGMQIDRLRPVVDSMAADGMKVTYFEATTALAALIFAQAEVDIVLWEVGMGGRMDATSVVTPVASVITGISLEHSEYLGNTIPEVAFEKAGIIKPGVPVFVSESVPEEAKAVIRNRADELGASYTEAPQVCARGTGLMYGLPLFTLADGMRLVTPLHGPHQRRNAALACTALKYLAPVLKIDLKNALAGFASTVWNARFQIMPERRFIMDGAHNPEAAGVLAETLREIFPDEKFHFIFGAFSDKDTAAALELLAPLAASFRFLHMETRRASRSAAELTGELAGIAPGVPAVRASLEDSLRYRPEDGRWRVLCGSLHLCGDAIAFFRNNP